MINLQKDNYKVLAVNNGKRPFNYKLSYFYEEVNILFDILFSNGVKYKIRENKTKKLSNEINAMKTCTNSGQQICP